MKTVLITGANKSIGFETARQLLQQGYYVYLGSRDIKKGQQAVSQLRSEGLNEVEPIEIDVDDSRSIKAAREVLGQKIQVLDVLINNAGIYRGSDFGTLDYTAWAESFKVNSMAPLKMAEAFTGHIAAGQLKKIATITSKMGSIDDNTSGGSYIYRSSKTAVNMVMKSLAIDLQPKGISAVTLHPGWVQTDMGGSNALINTRQSVSGMREVIDHLTLANSGRFIAYDGKEIAW